MRRLKEKYDLPTEEFDREAASSNQAPPTPAGGSLESLQVGRTTARPPEPQLYSSSSHSYRLVSLELLKDIQHAFVSLTNPDLYRNAGGESLAEAVNMITTLRPILDIGARRALTTREISAHAIIELEAILQNLRAILASAETGKFREAGALAGAIVMQIDDFGWLEKQAEENEDDDFPSSDAPKQQFEQEKSRRADELIRHGTGETAPL